MRILACILSAAALGAQAGTIHVAVGHAAAGDDDREGRGSAAYPYKTIGAAVAHAQAGDTVRVGPGIYADGAAKVAGYPRQRDLVALDKPVRIEATDGAAVTELRGGMAQDIATRCVHVLPSGAGAVVKGFTIANGWTRGDRQELDCGGGVWAEANAWIVDCAFTNCHGRLAAALHGGTAIRCFFSGNHSRTWDSGVVDCANLWNSVVWENGYSYGNRTHVAVTNVNCTYVGVFLNPSRSVFHNCIIMPRAWQNTEKNNVFSETPVMTNRVINPFLGLGRGDFRPIPNSIAVGIGQTAKLRGVFAVPDEFAKTDYAGGAIDYAKPACNAGAVQAVTDDPYAPTAQPRWPQFRDDTPMLQALLDSGKGVVTFPDGDFVLARPLLIGSDTHLVCSPKTHLKLADFANCPLIMNRGWQPGGWARNITVEGGVWDGNNVRQKRGQTLIPRNPGGGDWGQLTVFAGIANLTLRSMTFKDPDSYCLELTDIDGFTVDDLVFDCNDKTPNEDGLHIDGWARNGRITNVRGHTNDDLVALNSDEGSWRSPSNDIVNVVIDGLYGGTNGYTAVRLLSRFANVRDVVIRNVFGQYKYNGVSFTHWSNKWYDNLGHFDNITIENFYATSCQTRTSNEWGLLLVQGGVHDIGTVTVRNLSRVESVTNTVPTINVGSSVRIRKLVLDNVRQQVPDGKPLMRLADKSSKIEELVEK